MDHGLGSFRFFRFTRRPVNGNYSGSGNGYLFKKRDFNRLKIFGWSLIIALGIYIGLITNINQTTISGSETIGGSLVRRPWVWQHMENRLVYWSGAWSLFKENWLLGSGLWTFKELYPQTGLKFNPPHAHNMYLQTAAETGVIGIGLLVACLINLGSTIIRTFKKGGAEAADLNFYIAVSLSGFLLHNLIEYNWLAANFIYYFIFLVISVEVLNRENANNKNWKLMLGEKGYWPKLVIIIILLGTFAVVQNYRYH